MVHAFGTPKRHRQSGVFQFRKRVPAHLKETLGRSEIKFSLQTRDPALARIRNLEETARIERVFAELDGSRAGNSERFASCLYAEFSRARAAAGEPTPVAQDPRQPLSVSPRSATEDLSETSAPAAPAGRRPQPEVPLRALFGSYANEAQLSPATVKRWSPVLDRLIGHLGHDDAVAIARADVVA